MGLGLLIVIPVGISAVVGVAIWMGKENKKINKIEIDEDAPDVLNPFRKEFTHNHGKGILYNKRENKNGTTLIQFYPTDRKYRDRDKPIELESVIVKTGNVIKDTSLFSGEKNTIYLNSRDQSMMPEEMRDTSLAEWSAVKQQKTWLLDTFKKGLIAGGDEALAEAMREFTRGNVSRATLDQIKEENRIKRESQGGEGSK